MTESLAPAASPHDVRQIEEICDRFEAAWKAGQQPRLESYLEQAAGSLQAALLRELLYLDWEYRLRTGDPPRMPEYQRRFPEMGALLETIGREVTAVTSAGALLPQRLGKYRIVRQVGRGGMGVVYEAVHETLGRRVALKVLPKINVSDATARERFRREAQTTARLDHPNIVQIFEVGEQNGQPFLALEFVAGPSLGDYLRQAPQPPRQAAALVETLARAVHYAHERGIVHRDLKPANVLLAKANSETIEYVDGQQPASLPLAEYTPKITDFGLAYPVDAVDLTATGDIIGTPAYMAPEQAWGKSRQQLVGPAADVYALGAVLYEALTGRPAFQGATALEAIEQVRFEEPVPPRRLQPLVPRDLETVCLKCLEKEPARRYASAQALAEDLRRFLVDEPITARRTGPVERAKRWCRRNKSLAVSAVLGIVALVSATGLALNQAITAQVRREQQLTQTALRYAKSQKSLAEQNAEHLAQQQELTKAALVETEHFRQQAERLSASLALERGLTLFEQGDIARGMILLGRSLQIAPAGATELDRVIRLNLSAAYHQIPFHLRSVLEHGGEVYAVAFSPDGKVLLTGGRLRAPQRWDAATGEPIGEPLPHAGEIRAVAFSSDGSLIATAGTDMTARLWDAKTGRPFGQVITHKHWVQTVAISPDGSLVLTGSADGTARLWQSASGELRGTFLPPGWIQAVAFHPDGQTIATAAGRRVWFWDAVTGNQVGEPMVHEGEVWAIAYSPDGRVLLTGSEEGTARLWEAETGKSLGFPLLHQGPVRAVGYSQDGACLWTADAHGKVRLWDAMKMTPLGAPVTHQSAVYAVALSPDRARLATGSADGKVRLWDKPVPRPPGVQLPHTRLVYCVAVSPDGKTVATGSADRRVQLWNALTGEPVGKPLTHDASVFRVAFSPDGQTILTGSSDKTARLWNASDGTPRGPVLQHPDEVYAVAFSPDGQRVLTGCKDSTARLWNAATGESIGQPLKHARWVHAVAFSPDGQTILTGCEDKTARLWNVSNGEPIGEPLEHRGPVRDVAFSPDGSRLLTGTWDDGTARFWDVRTRQPIGPPMPHQEHVLTVAISPDGKTVATGTWDGTARLWDVATGKPLGPPLLHQRTIREVAFSPDGKTLWSAGFDRTVRSWELPVGVAGDVEKVLLWIQVLTGMELDADGLFRELDAATWLERRERLNKLGDPDLSRRDPRD